MPDTICWFCGKPGAKRREHASGKFYREPACDDCFADMKKSGYAVKGNTPLPAAEFRRLADEMIGVDDYGNPCLNMPKYEAYRAALATSPRTREEVLLINYWLGRQETKRMSLASVDGKYFGQSDLEIDSEMKIISYAGRLAGEGGVA